MVWQQQQRLCYGGVIIVVSAVWLIRLNGEHQMCVEGQAATHATAPIQHRPGWSANATLRVRACLASHSLLLASAQNGAIVALPGLHWDWGRCG